MSRTIRRKNLKRRWYNYDSDEHFTRIQYLISIGNPFPEECRGWSGYFPQAPCALKEHREAEWHNLYSRQKHTYKEYVAYEDAMFYTDRGWHHGASNLWRGMGGKLGSCDRNTSFERPHRRAMKQFIHRCVVDDVWDSTVVPEYKCRGWWMYYD